MGRKLSGKDGLNIWVTNFKENLVDKLVGKWVTKKVVENFCEQTAFTNWVIKIVGKIVWKNL